ncbi:hemin receptor [Bacteroidia bacterium]|nr:hemin receptor [Bacteroidia bacterium]
MKRNLFILVALFVSISLFGQGEIDAYRISKKELSGTARGQAMGGAFGALGGDVTGVSINPAGIGVYHSSEVIFNAGLTFNNTKATFENSEESKGNTSVSCDNFAYIGYYPLGNDDRFSLNFGFNYNRLKNFDRKYKTSGKGMTTSLTDYMADITNGTPYNFFTKNNGDYYYADGHPRWLGILGWSGFLINPSGNTSYNDDYVSPLTEGEKVDPSLEVRERGSIGAYDFTLGTNINNRLYLGTSLTYTDISYVTETSYNENFEHGGGFKLVNDYNTEGSGLQVKLGLIFKPVDAFRIGLSYHSPTWYTLTDYFQGTVYPNRIPDGDGGWADNTATPNGAYQEYRFKTPDVWTLSAAAVLGGFAILSLDYEYTDYSMMKFSKQNINDYDFEYENGDVKGHFKGASTVRAGAEFRFTPQFSGRVGCAWMQNPYDQDYKNNKKEVMTIGTVPNYTLEGDVLYLTTGIGYRFTPQFYMDFALIYRTQQDELHFYSPLFNGDGSVYLASAPTKMANRSVKTLVTLGYKF